MNIGNWTRRHRGRWHLTESIIEEAAITRCGRRMEARTGGGELEVAELMPLTRAIGQPQLCRQCHREPRKPRHIVVDAQGAREVFEDDPAVGQVDPE